MKLKKLWKILIPATAIAAVTASLPLAFASCSSASNDEQAKPDTSLVINFLNNDNIVDPYKNTYIEAMVENENENDYDFEWFYEPKGSNKWEKINGVTGQRLTIPEEWVNDTLNNTAIKVRVSSQTDPTKWNEKVTYIKVADTPTKSNIDPNMLNTGFSSIGLFSRKVVGTTPRTPNSQLYTPAAMQQYGEKGFKYPGYDYSYKQHKDQKIDNKLISTICMEETTTGLNGPVKGDSAAPSPRYNDATWILQQIKDGTLKKHPAYEGIYEQKIPDNLQASTTQFSIGTGMTGPVNLGLYAPAGEIISLTFDEQTWNLLKQQNFIGMQVAINNNFWNCKDAGDINKRYPFIRSYFGINNTTVDNATRTIKFGSPFGGGISIKFTSPLKSPGAAPFDTSSVNLNFTVSGAVQTLLYVDGQTTEDDWNKQKQACLDSKLAPVLQANSAYFSFTLPFTGVNQINGLDVGTLRYPAIIFKKMSDFLFLSNYYSSRDLRGPVVRLDMQFADEIWGGQGAWGGGNNLYCPTKFASELFFKLNPITGFSASKAWGIFHEINHSFEQNGAFFQKRTHGETNQVTLFNLSVIGDVGRYRSELNWTGEQGKSNNSLGWSRLENPFTTIKDLIKDNDNPTKRKDDEYPIYALMLYALGSKNYSDYVRWDTKFGKWTNGFDEIATISDKFHTNFWPAFFDYGRFWSDEWPTQESQITPEQKTVIEQLSKKYPAMDFVANQYACGNYLYNQETNSYDYNGDVLPAFEIPAGMDYTLDLSNFVVSVNQNFKWSKVIFPQTTLQGGSLSLDPKNSKNLIYHPSSNIKNDDEFTITIVPDSWEGKPANYVPGYKFKIKLRQVVNEPYLYSTTNLGNSNNYSDMFAKMEAMKPEDYDYCNPIGFMNPPTDLVKDKKMGTKVSLKFVVPKDGNYKLNAKWDDAIRVYVDGSLRFSKDTWTDKMQTTAVIPFLSKGDVIPVDIYCINKNGAGGLNFQFEVDKKPIDAFEYALAPNYNVVLPTQTPETIITNPDYQYKLREIDHSVFHHNLSARTNFSNVKFPVYNPNTDYTLSSTTNTNINNLNSYGQTYMEDWNVKNNNLPYASFTTTFTKPSKVRSLLFGHRTNNHWSARATKIKVTITDANQQKYVAYEGTYGKEFGDREGNYSVLNLNKTYVAHSIFVEMWNETTKPNERGAVILQWFRPSDKMYIPFGDTIALNDPSVEYYGDWEIKANDETNKSPFNSKYIVSTRKKDKIALTLNNVYGFVLIGQTNAIGNTLQIKINDQLVDTVNIQSVSTQQNSVLYSYRGDQPTDLYIEITHLDNNPLYLDYIMTLAKYQMPLQK